jgi:hypothetical protein
MLHYFLWAKFASQFILFRSFQPNLMFCEYGLSHSLSWPYSQTLNYRLVWDKHASLFRPFVSYSCEKFYNTGPYADSTQLYSKLAVLTNIRLGCKGLSGTNTLAYSVLS